MEIEHADRRRSSDFPDHWGDAPPAREEARRLAWIRDNIAKDEATGVPQARRAARTLEQQDSRLRPRVYAALVALAGLSGLGPKPRR